MLQAKASYTQIGIFSAALWPYSFKLFWSPIVDSLWWASFGRRKSWVVSPVPGCAQLVFAAAHPLVPHSTSSCWLGHLRVPGLCAVTSLQPARLESEAALHR